MKIFSLSLVFLALLGCSKLYSMDTELPLLEAARTGNCALVKQFINTKSNLNVKNSVGNTALMLAAFMGHIMIVKALIAAGANVNAQDTYGNTALIQAALKGHVLIVQALITAHADINIQDKDGYTALLWAAQENTIPTVRALIAAGADITSANNDGYTPLIYSARLGNTALVLELITLGASVNEVTKNGSTALSWAIFLGHYTTIQILIAAGAHLLKKHNGYIPFKIHLEKLFACSRTAFTSYTSTADYLLHHTHEVAQLRTLNELIKKHHFRLDSIGSDGNTLLHNAVLTGNKIMIGLLLYLMIKQNECNALNYRDRTHKMTPIEMAATKAPKTLLPLFFMYPHIAHAENSFLTKMYNLVSSYFS